MTHLLMSFENPNGAKLEELLEIIVDDLKLKTEAIRGDDCPKSIDIIRRNDAIIQRLEESRELQLETLRDLGHEV